jgi:DNA polymerase-3 subunit epsilon
MQIKKRIKLCFFSLFRIMFAIVDLETSGLDASKHEILEIGMVVLEPRSNRLISTLDIKVQPEHIETADPVSLKINGYTKERWKDAVPLKEALERMQEMANKATLMTYNVTFDNAFLEAAFLTTSIPSFFHYHRMDLMTLAWWELGLDKPASLKRVCKMCSIPPEDDRHEALQGALKAYQVFKHLKTRRMRPMHQKDADDEL